MTYIPDREAAIQAGTLFLTAAEIAPRLGLAASAKGVRKVLAMVKARQLPAFRPNKRVVRFHWPTVVDAIAGKAPIKRRMGRISA